MSDAAGGSDRRDDPGPLERAPARYFPGDVIDGRYEVLAHVGAGGAGDVYRVLDRVVEYEFALKVYNGTIGSQAAIRELMALIQVEDLRHVVRVFDIGKTATAPPQVYLKSEFIDGVSLDELIAHGSERNLDVVRSIGEQLLAALVAIHPNAARIAEIEAKEEQSYEEYQERFRLQELGRVHRDVKPGNLMVAGDGRLKLLDFNIAMQAGRTVLTRTHSAGYTPPDADLRWDPGFDLFSAGVVLFEVLCGVHPFEDRLTSGRRFRVGDFRPDLGPGFESFFAKALAPDRESRYSNAVDMRADFLALLEEGGASLEQEIPESEAVAIADALGDRLSRVRREAERAGLAAQFDEACRVADRRGLGKRGYVRSLMLTPPDDTRTVLVNLEFRSAGSIRVYAAEGQWESIYGVSDLEAADLLGPLGSRTLDGAQVNELLSGLDRLVDRPVIGTRRATADAGSIVELLESAPDATFTSEQVAAALMITKRHAGKVLSRLIGPGCPKRYEHRIVRVGKDEYQAVSGAEPTAPDARRD